MSTRHAQSASTVTEAQVLYYDALELFQGVESLPTGPNQLQSLHTLLNRAIPFTGRALCTF